MNKWDTLTPVLIQSIGETVYMVAVSLLISGVAGLVIGALLYATRPATCSRIAWSSPSRTS